MSLTSTDEKQGLVPCQTTGFDMFSPLNIKKFEDTVRSIQWKLDKAVANDDKDLIRWYEQAKGYWEKRKYMNAKDSIYGSVTLTRLFQR